MKSRKNPVFYFSFTDCQFVQLGLIKLVLLAWVRLKLGFFSFLKSISMVNQTVWFSTALLEYGEVAGEVAKNHRQPWGSTLGTKGGPLLGLVTGLLTRWFKPEKHQTRIKTQVKTSLLIIYFETILSVLKFKRSTKTFSAGFSTPSFAYKKLRLCDWPNKCLWEARSVFIIVLNQSYLVFTLMGLFLQSVMFYFYSVFLTESVVFSSCFVPTQSG